MDGDDVLFGGTNLIGVGGVSSTVAVEAGQNRVTDLSQNGVISGGTGNLVADFGIGNHTILGGTGDDRREREQEALPMLVGAY